MFVGIVVKVWIDLWEINLFCDILSSLPKSMLYIFIYTGLISLSVK